MSPADDRFLTFLSSLKVRQRYGDVSDMWLHRRTRDGSGFPQPLFIAGRRFWRLSDLVAWEARTVARPVRRSRPGTRRDAPAAAASALEVAGSMARPNASRAAHRGDGADPRKAVLLGSEQHISSEQPAADQLIFDLPAAIERSRADTALADALRAAIERRAGQ